MTRLIPRLLALLLLLGSSGTGAIAPMEFDSPQQRERFKALTEELRCLVCQNQSLADSDAGLAQDMRREVLKMMKAGRTDQEIRGFLVERYGDFILYDPPIEPSTWLLWFGPLLILLAGAAGLAVALRRRAQLPQTDENGSNR